MNQIVGVHKGKNPLLILKLELKSLPLKSIMHDSYLHYLTLIYIFLQCYCNIFVINVSSEAFSDTVTMSPGCLVRKPFRLIARELDFS